MSKLVPLIVAGGACLDDQIFLALERDSPWPDDDVVAVTAVVETFVAAGTRGAFPCPGIAPAQQQLALVGAGVVNGPTLGYWFRGQHLDPRAFQLVRHMVSRLEPPGDSVVRISAGVTGPGVPPRRNLPVIDYDNEGSEYPQAVDVPGFGVYWDDSLSYSKARRILVELTAEIEGPPVDDFIAHVACWGALLEAGALALPLGLPDVMDNVMGMITQFDAFTLELEVPVYQSSEVGFDLLINLLSAYHARERPIRLVTIE